MGTKRELPKTCLLIPGLHVGDPSSDVNWLALWTSKSCPEIYETRLRSVSHGGPTRHFSSNHLTTPFMNEVMVAVLPKHKLVVTVVGR